MNKLILAAMTVVTSLTVGAAAMHVTKADAASSKCTVDVIGTENSANKPNSKFTKDGEKVTAKVKVTGNNCDEPVALLSFKSVETNRPLSAQRLYDADKVHLKAGVHTLTVKAPNCYYQIDLVRGLHDLTTDSGAPIQYGPDRNMGWLVGGQKACEEIHHNPQPSAACESLDVKKLTRTHFQFKAQASTKNDAKIKAYVFTVTKGGKTIDTKTIRTDDQTAKFTYKQTEAGDYKVKVTVKTSEGDKTDPACKGSFTVKVSNPELIEVCDLTTHQIREIKKSEMSDRYTTDLTKCGVPTPDTPDSPTTTPKTLVNTGPGAVAAVAGGVSTLSGLGHFLIRRRLFL